MGIEPTDHTVNVRPYGFENRGHHQVCKHFHVLLESQGHTEPQFQQALSYAESDPFETG